MHIYLCMIYLCMNTNICICSLDKSLRGISMSTPEAPHPPTLLLSSFLFPKSCVKEGSSQCWGTSGHRVPQPGTGSKDS